MHLKDLLQTLRRRSRTWPPTSGLPQRSVSKLSSAVRSAASSRATGRSSSSTYRSTKPMKTLPSAFTVACVSRPRCLWADIFTSCTRSKKRGAPRRPGRRSRTLDQHVSSRWTTYYRCKTNPNSQQTCSATGRETAKSWALEQAPRLLFSQKHRHLS